MLIYNQIMEPDINVSLGKSASNQARYARMHFSSLTCKDAIISYLLISAVHLRLQFSTCPSNNKLKMNFTKIAIDIDQVFRQSSMIVALQRRPCGRPLRRHK